MSDLLNAEYNYDSIYVKRLLTFDEEGNSIIDSRKYSAFLNFASSITKITCNSISCCDIKIIDEILLSLCTCCVNLISFEFNDNILPDKLPNGEINESVKDFFILIQEKLNNNIIHLDFSGSTLYSIINLNAILNKLPQLEYLNLTKTNIVQLLYSMLNSKPIGNKIPIKIPNNIQELIISDVKLQDYCLEYFFYKPYPFLQNLNLSNNSISKGIEIITKYNYTSLHTLSLKNNLIDAQSAYLIGKWLINCPMLRVIDLAGNNLSDNGAKDVTVNIKKLKNIEEIYLSRNDISDSGFISLLTNCSDSNSLIHVNVSENKIMMNINVKKSILNKLSIKILSIYGNPIRDINDTCEKCFKNLGNLEELRIK